MSKRVIYDLSITVLEDLHSGTGTGTLSIDSVQARNKDGRPVIDRHHFHGVLKDNAKRLEKLNCLDSDMVKALFGESGGQTPRRMVDCSSLTVVENAPDNTETVTWTTTARVKGKRQPKANSLRQIEYIAAGCVLQGRILLHSDTPELKRALDKIINFTSRVGGERTRGSGQILIESTCIEESERPTGSLEASLGKGNVLRLLITNPEPLCIPRSGYAGNIIRTESYIPGKVLFAAIVGKAFRQNGEPEFLKGLFDNGVHVGNAYPLPVGWDGGECNLSMIESIPMPLHYQYGKEHQNENSPEVVSLPHWAQESDNPLPLCEVNLYDIFSMKKDRGDEGSPKTKRAKGEQYLCRDSHGLWHRYIQPLAIRMRNCRGGPNENIPKEQTELFSVQRIPENTTFIAEIRFSKNADKTRWFAEIADWEAGGFVIAGRGGSPLHLLEVHCVSSVFEPRTSRNNFTLTFTSDWMIRGRNLGYLQELDMESFTHLFGCIGLDVRLADDDGAKTVQQDYEEHGSFNYASGLPRRPCQVIIRGSSYRFHGPPESIEHLRNRIVSRECWGEQTREGYGRYMLDFDALSNTEKERRQ